MDVVLNCRRHCEVDDSFDPTDVETSGGHVGREQDVDLVFLEPLEGVESQGLRHIAVQLTHSNTQQTEHNVKSKIFNAWIYISVDVFSDLDGNRSVQ